MLKLPQNTATLLLGVLVVNVIGLWTVYLLSPSTHNSDHQSPIANQPPAKLLQSPSSATNRNSVFTLATPELIATQAAQVKELQQQLAEIAESMATLAAKPMITLQPITPTTQINQTKEYVIYLGSGGTTSREWIQIAGTKTDINSINYAPIKSVEFQALLKTIGGEVRARLKNTTTGAVFYDSEVMHNSSEASWASRTGLKLSPGSNEYVVELRSSSGELAQLEGARLRITVE